MKKALITGITGQDGSYLAEFLLNKGYEVHGIIRRTSSYVRQRIDHLSMDPEIKDKTLFLHYGDMTDGSNISRLIEKIMPDEVYNLAAQSHVKISFDVPEYSAQVDGIGTIRILDALRELCPKAKFYQASTSELYGLVQETPQRETTPFYPRSPYAVAKLYAYWITRNYREAYNMFACNGILFNHETLTYSMPLILKDRDNKIDILPIGDIARFHTGIVFDLENRKYQEGKPIRDIKVWDQNGWTKVKWVSGYPHRENDNKNIISVNSRNYSYTATGSHVAILENNKEKQTQELCIGDKTKKIEYPETNNKSELSLEKAEFLGMLVGDGNLCGNNPRFTNKDKRIKNKFKELWTSFTGNKEFSDVNTKSGFTGENIGQVICKNTDKIKFDIYTNDVSVFGHKLKKVPKEILNSPPEVMEAFLIGYNTCDGLKKNKCTYCFKNFKTNSPTLAAGLLFLVSKVTGQEYNVSLEESYKHGKQQIYYSINLLTTTDNKAKEEIVKSLINDGYSQRKICRETGISRVFIRKIQNGGHAEKHHFRKTHNEIKKLISIDKYNGWLFDLETESGTFHAGVGQGVVHNSERRGENFVTRKITMSVARIAKGLQEKVSLGNLSALRDWGYAPDYVRGMWMMLQQDEPMDIVMATGEQHSVEDFCKVAFDNIWMPLEFRGEGIDRKGYDEKGNVRVDVNPKFFRPTEVQTLLGDPTKAKEVLGWEPTVSFQELVTRMVDNDLKELK